MRRTPLSPGPEFDSQGRRRYSTLEPSREPLKRARWIRGGLKNGIPEIVRREVNGRSGGSCERCHVARADHLHHRLMRSQGGKNTTSNLLHVCALCHAAIHASPAESYDRGWLIRYPGGTP